MGEDEIVWCICCVLSMVLSAGVIEKVELVGFYEGLLGIFYFVLPGFEPAFQAFQAVSFPQLHTSDPKPDG